MFDTLVVTGGGTAGRVLHGESVSTALHRVITDHPGLVDSITGSAPGTIGCLAALSPLTALTLELGPGLPTTVPEGAALVGRLYPEGSPEVADLGADDSGAGQHAPRNVTDLLVALDRRSAGGPGEIDVRVVWKRVPDGTVQSAYIVDIPGTKVWNLPGPRPAVNDTGTNLRALGNEATAYQRGIDEALARAGARPGDPVMLVGHSQGGIVAAQAARDFVQSGRYSVTHVVTAGSPVAQVGVPRSVQVLSIENRHDIVPRLDGRDNPDAANRVTVTVDQQNGSAGANHALGKVYVPAAAGVDRSGHPSVRAYVDSAARFFGGDTVSTRRFRVERRP
jgi:pimeloyl-ACP methyl ester carboxylesterase